MIFKGTAAPLSTSTGYWVLVRIVIDTGGLDRWMFVATGIASDVLLTHALDVWPRQLGTTGTYREHREMNEALGNARNILGNRNRERDDGNVGTGTVDTRRHLWSRHPKLQSKQARI